MKKTNVAWIPTGMIALLAALPAGPAAAAGEAPATDTARQLTSLTTLMNSIPDILFYKDLEGVYRGGNRAWARLAGKPLDQLLGRTDLDLFPGELGKSFRAKDQEMLATGRPRRNEEWVVYPDGRRALLDTLKTPWVDENGKTLGVLGICREITPDPATIKEVRAANEQFYRALNRMFTGDIAPMQALWSHADDVTYMGPGGGFETGWTAVNRDWEAQAAMKLGGRVTASGIRITAGRELAVVANYEKGENTNARGAVQKVSIRATNLFRKEDGTWKMIGHHVDLLPKMAE